MYKITIEKSMGSSIELEYNYEKYEKEYGKKQSLI